MRHDPIKRAIEGDIRAWAELYATHYTAVFRHMRYITGNAALAEELAQECFAEAMASRKTYDPARPFAAWLRGVALNVARKHWRQHMARVQAHGRLEVIANISPGATDLDRDHFQRERAEALHAALLELPDRWREAFVLKELEGLSAAEVGALLGITAANVDVRVTRARQRLRTLLAARGWIAAGQDGHS